MGITLVNIFLVLGRSKVMLFFWISCFNFLSFVLDHCTFGEVDAQCRCLVSAGYCSAKASADSGTRWCFQHRYHTSSCFFLCVYLPYARIIPVCECFGKSPLRTLNVSVHIRAVPLASLQHPLKQPQLALMSLMCSAEEEAVRPSCGCSGTVQVPTGQASLPQPLQAVRFCLTFVLTVVWVHMITYEFSLQK